MKLILTLLILALLAAGIAPLLIKGPDGRPLMQVSDFLPSALNPQSDRQQRPSSAVNPPLGDGGTIYRWQDDNGQWHYSDAPPTHTRSENVTLKPINTVPGLTPDTSGNQSTPEHRRNPAANHGSEAPSPLSSVQDDLRTPKTLGPETVEELMDQLKASQRRIQARQAELDALLDK